MAAQTVPILVLNDNRKFPALGLGTYKPKKDEIYESVKYAIKVAGYRHLDCAHFYENEADIGRALKDLFDEGVVKREEVFITSKLWNTFHEHDHALRSLDITLRNLQLDYIDLYLIHWPQGFAYVGENEFVPKDENGQILVSDVEPVDTWRTMIELQKSGKTKSIGVSNFSIKQVDQLIAETGVVPAVNQVECHPYLPQKELLEHHRKHNIIITAYSPLGAPDRTKENDPVLINDPIIADVAKKHNRSVADVLIAFHLNRNASVVPKSSNPERILSNIKASEIKLTSDDMHILENLNKNFRYCKFAEQKNFLHFPF